jgi:Eco29kI restriction endonuclease
MALAPDRAAIKALEEALTAVLSAVGSDPPQAVVRRLREGLAAHADAVEAARSITDPIRMPRATFDPADPKAIGRMVSIALLAQPLIPLTDVQPAYGSGVYAIYYRGDHPLYVGISGSETPIYVGKADPANDDASTTREQGAKLTARLLEHAGTIGTVEGYAEKLPTNLSPIRLTDFVCRRLVCATNAQLVAEKHLIRTFWPVWNAQTKACWGMSKHGDAAKTRANKKSPWDVVHPGRLWALDQKLVDSLTPNEIAKRIDATLQRVPARRDHAALLEEMLAGFRQDDATPSVGDDIPPVGESAAGPDLDEAGGADDQ